MQKTNFKYEILIHDDASTDNTSKILKEYEEKYPEIIKVIYQSRNQTSMGISVISILLEKAQGKYLAFCEGDDYWIEEYKLQKQIDFLKNNSTYSAVYHNVKIVDEKNCKLNDRKARGVFPLYKDHTLMKSNMLIGVLTGQLGSLVCINFWKNFTVDSKKAYCKCKVNGDLKINIILNNIGNIKFFSNIMSCYRRTYIGDSYNARTKDLDLTQKGYLDIFLVQKMIFEIFGYNLSENIIKRSKTKYLVACFINSIRNKNLKRLNSSLKLYIESDIKLYSIYYFCKRSIVYFLKKLSLIEVLPQDECFLD